MKIRNGFVSNSSSSSFICDVSGEVVEGYDYCLSDVDMVECANGHTFFDHFVLPGWEVVRDEDSDEYVDDWRYALPAKYCPLCALKEIDSSDVARYLAKINNRTVVDVEEEIRSKFSTLKHLEAFLST